MIRKVGDQTTEDEKTFQELLTEVGEVGRIYGDAIFMGGIAVYLHSVHNGSSGVLAKDADFYVSGATMSDLREIEDIVLDSSLSKHEFKRKGFSFGVYTERQNTLPVPYDQVAANAVTRDGVRVAALEELLVLKLEAAGNRRSSAQSRKDVRDVINILLLAGDIDFDAPRAVEYMWPKQFQHLEQIINGDEFGVMADGNAKSENVMRQAAGEIFQDIARALEDSGH